MKRDDHVSTTLQRTPIATTLSRVERGLRAGWLGAVLPLDPRVEGWVFERIAADLVMAPGCDGSVSEHVIKSLDCVSGIVASGYCSGGDVYVPQQAIAVIAALAREWHDLYVISTPNRYSQELALTVCRPIGIRVHTVEYPQADWR